MKTTRILTITVLFIGLFLSFTASLGAQEEGELTPIQEKLYNLRFDIFTQEVEAPDFSVPRLEGGQAKLSHYRGQLVLLNLWATWCPPCRAEMPSMQALYDDLKDRGFTILAVAAPNPPRETEGKIRAYIEENNYTFPVLLDCEYKAYGIYNTGSIPTSYLVDTEGKLVARLTGSIDWHKPDIVDALSNLLPPR